MQCFIKPMIMNREITDKNLKLRLEYPTWCNSILDNLEYPCQKMSYLWIHYTQWKITS